MCIRDSGIGELTTVTESFGVTTYSYNSLGQMTRMTRSIDGQNYASSYTYDLAGEVLTQTYPSGRVVSLTRDAAARIISIAVQDTAGSEVIPILDNITYAPFGPLTGASFGDGYELVLDYDTAYRAKTLRRTTLESSLMDISSVSYTHLTLPTILLV